MRMLCFSRQALLHPAELAACMFLLQYVSMYFSRKIVLVRNQYGNLVVYKCQCSYDMSSLELKTRSYLDHASSRRLVARLWHRFSRIFGFSTKSPRKLIGEQDNYLEYKAMRVFVTCA